MARIVFFHNDQDAVSRDLLSQLEVAYGAQVERLDFMDVRSILWFRGCPSVWLFPADTTGYENPVWKGEVDITKADVDAVLNAARIIHLATDAPVINRTGGAAPTQAVITATLTDLDGNPAIMDGVTFVVGGQKIEALDGILQFSSDTVGTFTIACQHPAALEATIEEVVN